MLISKTTMKIWKAEEIDDWIRSEGLDPSLGGCIFCSFSLWISKMSIFVKKTNKQKMYKFKDQMWKLNGLE